MILCKINYPLWCEKKSLNSIVVWIILNGLEQDFLILNLHNIPYNTMSANQIGYFV